MSPAKDGAAQTIVAAAANRNTSLRFMVFNVGRSDAAGRAGFVAGMVARAPLQEEVTLR